MISATIAEIVESVAMEDAPWSLIVSGDESATVEELIAELEYMTEETEESVKRIEFADSAQALVSRLQADGRNTLVVLTGIANVGSEELIALDALRNALLGAARVVVVTSETGATHLRTLAPNLWSWSDVWRQLRVDDADPDARLESLRQQTSLTDTQVRRMAEAGNLPSDPIFAEWLTLLKDT